MYKWCEEFENALWRIKEMEMAGEEPSYEDAEKITTLWNACQILRMDDYWSGYRKEYAKKETGQMTDKEMRDWVAEMWHMENGVKKMGQHWTVEQTTAVASMMGLEISAVGDMGWWTAMHMAWHDYQKAAEYANMQNDPKFYANLAEGFLMDADGGMDPKQRLWSYWEYM